MYSDTNCKLIRIAICDDSSEVANQIERIISLWNEKNSISATITSFTSSMKLLQKTENRTTYDIVFLDIDMPEINGLKLADKIKTYSPDTLVIFVTGHSKYVFSSFKVQPFRYVLKSNIQSGVTEAITESINKLKSMDKRVFLKQGAEIVSLSPKNVLFCESMDKNVRIVYADYESVIKYKISSLEKLLNPYGFIRSHKGFLVNKEKISGLSKKYITLDNGTEIPISRYRYNEILSKLLTLDQEEI